MGAHCFPTRERATWQADTKTGSTRESEIVELARWCIEGCHYEWACFAAQQAAEKVIKAVFQKLGGEAWGHSRHRLVEGAA